MIGVDGSGWHERFDAARAAGARPADAATFADTASPLVTTVVSMTLREFLLARIAEDEAVASDAAVQDRPPWTATDGYVVPAEGGERGARYGGLWDNEGSGSLCMADQTAEHVARQDPARVLAECKAKRRIVGMADGSEDFVTAMPRPGYAQPFHSPSVDILIRAQQLLALPYADHPDYREEWKP